MELSACCPALVLAHAVALFHLPALEANQIFFCMAIAIYLYGLCVCVRVFDVVMTGPLTQSNSCVQ